MKDAENWVGQKVACHKGIERKFLKVEGHKGEEGRSEEEKKGDKQLKQI